MKWKDPIAANELMDKIDNVESEMIRLRTILNDLNINLENYHKILTESLIVQHGYYFGDRLLHDYDNNFWKYVLSSNCGIYSWDNYYNELFKLQNHEKLKEYLYELFEEN